MKLFAAAGKNKNCNERRTPQRLGEFTKGRNFHEYPRERSAGSKTAENLIRVHLSNK